MAFDLSDYVDVAERLRLLFEKHPEASLRDTHALINVGDQTFVTYRAECFRTPDDPAPGVGTAWELIPGKTPYTKDSELQNAETAAWGRAILAVGAASSKHVASANEVRARATQPVVKDDHVPASAGRVKALKRDVEEAGLTEFAKQFKWPWNDEACDQIAAELAKLESPF